MSATNPHTLLKALAAACLSVVARGVLRRYHPKVVMVTGSVGKTSTKDAVAAVLSARYLVRASEKSFNSEFGVPFTVLDVHDPVRRVASWFRVLQRAVALLLLPNHYPNLLVLEVGADKPGDLARILKIAKPNAVVVTRLPEIPVHVEAYTSPEAVREEEFAPAYALPRAAPLIVSSDNAYALDFTSRLPAHVYVYGESEGGDVQIEEVAWYEEAGKIVGMSAVVRAGNERADFVLKGSAGKVQLFAPAAALATGLALGIPFDEALSALASYEPPPGRGRLFAGIHGATVLDDSYNSSPAAVEEALLTLKDFPYAKRRVAILGDMLELGRYSVMEHARIGEKAAETAALLVTVGVRAKGIAEAARAAGLAEESVLSFDDSTAAAEALPALVEAGDVVLVKGSQSIRMERIVEALLADKKDVSRLVRQGAEWRKRA